MICVRVRILPNVFSANAPMSRKKHVSSPCGKAAHLEGDDADFVAVLVGTLQEADGGALRRVHPVQRHRSAAGGGGGYWSEGGSDFEIGHGELNQ